MDELPEWHEAGLDPASVINLRGIAELKDAPDYAALRSYATGRRENPLLGPMPAAVARIANRRLWLKDEIDAWLRVPIPKWKRTKFAIARWIEAGRPRDPQPNDWGPGRGRAPRDADGRPQAEHTLAGDHGRSTPAP